MLALICSIAVSAATVPPLKNCLRFAESFKAAGGDLEIVAREPYGHHPHGLEIDEQRKFVDFFTANTPPLSSRSTSDPLKPAEVRRRCRDDALNPRSDRRADVLNGGE